MNQYIACGCSYIGAPSKRQKLVGNFAVFQQEIAAAVAAPCWENAEGFVLHYDDDAAEFLKTQYADDHLTLEIVTAAQGQYWFMME